LLTSRLLLFLPDGRFSPVRDPSRYAPISMNLAKPHGSYEKINGDNGRGGSRDTMGLPGVYTFSRFFTSDRQ